MTKRKLRMNIVHEIMELRNKDLIEEDSIFDVLDDCLNPFIDEMEEKIKNDYFFTLEVSDKRSGNIREVKSIVSAENVEKAFMDVQIELSKTETICQTIKDVKKL